MAEGNAATWYAGICDALLAKIQWWLANYERGAVRQTRKFLNHQGVVVDVPTMYQHTIPFRQAEVDHLVRIVSALRPKQAGMLELLKITQRDLKKYPMRPGGLYVAPLPYFKADVQEMLDALLEAKEGKPALEEHIQKQQSEGKFLWDT